MSRVICSAVLAFFAVLPGCSPTQDIGTIKAEDGQTPAKADSGRFAGTTPEGKEPPTQRAPEGR